ncbi:MAG: Ig-like domain-containing protein, partial [Bacteroidales bacterium]|nr:Ig-like domain-containing protein [Candidatus Sodaliphilus limicaballi]
QKVISITLNYKTLSMKVGEKADLTVAVLPTDADNRTVTFTSSNPEVATVVEGARGRRSVQALAPGSAYIYCRANDGGGASASIRVTVTE